MAGDREGQSGAVGEVKASWRAARERTRTQTAQGQRRPRHLPGRSCVSVDTRTQPPGLGSLPDGAPRPEVTAPSGPSPQHLTTNAPLGSRVTAPGRLCNVLLRVLLSAQSLAHARRHSDNGANEPTY